MSQAVAVNDASLQAPLFEWRELRSYHDFLALMVWREMHMRYRHTLIGVGWSFLNPLMTMAEFGLNYYFPATVRLSANYGRGFASTGNFNQWTFAITHRFTFPAFPGRSN